jgi:hypothetical protein
MHNEELHNLYSSPNIVKGIISRRAKQMRRLATHGRNGKMCKHFSLSERHHFEAVVERIG